jgi:polyhydroxyalkanoate synthase
MSKYNSTYNKAFQQALKTEYKDNEYRHYNKFDAHNPSPYDKIYQNWLKNSDVHLGDLLKSKEFVSSLSKYLTLSIDVHKALRNIGYPIHYFDALFEVYVRNMYLASSVQKDFELTPFDIEYTSGNIRLLHYHKENNDKDSSPLLIIYAQINRFHIMDIHPSRSVVKSLLSKGLDVYLLDWGYPSSKDNDVSLNDYVQYVREAIQHIHEKNSGNKKREENASINIDRDKVQFNSKDRINKIVVNDASPSSNNKGIVTGKPEGKGESETNDKNKISILGYCWGGIVALIFASLYSEHIKNLTLMAVPVDLSKDNTILSTWAKAIDVGKLVDEFAHLDGQILDIGFVMRNPFRYTFDKYVTAIKKYDDKEFIDLFVGVEKWLYDTPIVPAKFFKQIIDGCYKNNLLIQNRLKVNGNLVDLKNIHVPLLTIVSEKDDLVTPESTLEVNNHVSSMERKTIESPGGHVALCVSKVAHEKLWPEAAEWILSKYDLK